MPKCKQNKPSTQKRKAKVVKKKKITCCICISDIDERTAASIDCCNHKYCTDCIETWAKTENSCPQCKKKFSTITSLKKGCKRKTVSTTVEDKRQRPDTPGQLTGPSSIAESLTDLRLAHRMGMITTVQRNSAYTRVLSVLLGHFNNQDVLPEEYFSLGITPWQFPADVVYDPMVRQLVLIFFAGHEPFRNEMLLILSSPLGLLPVQPPQYKVELTQMFFNIVNRFMSITGPTVQNTYTQWLRTARRLVFSQNEVIDVELEEPERPTHRPLRSNMAICCQKQVVEFYYRLTDASDDQMNHALQERSNIANTSVVDLVRMYPRI